MKQIVNTLEASLIVVAVAYIATINFTVAFGLIILFTVFDLIKEPGKTKKHPSKAPEPEAFDYE
ncbi:hypothetical protein [Enterococcus faecalis]|uniref:hypothetical protein n=1 Tax=Enterococcus faecalis TaxID=1351 RepID=UPI004042CFDC